MHTDRYLLSPVALSGLLPFFVACTDLKSSLHHSLVPPPLAQQTFSSAILENGHYVIYHLALAMYPRILTTLDAELNPLITSVRVGNAVDIVGQAGSCCECNSLQFSFSHFSHPGKPKTITVFVTNNTPVLLGFGERAQLATDQYVPLTSILENFVILKKNPEYDS